MSKVKVLFLAADPLSADPGRAPNEQHPRLRIDEELRVISARIRDAGASERVQLVPWLAARADDFLLALETERPHVVHFSGHGNEAGEIIVVGHDGGPQTIGGEALLDLFRTLKEEIRVVVFNACHTHLPAERISTIIDCTIGMSQPVTDQAALTFSASFYRAIGFGRSVRDAYNQGLVALALENIVERRSPRLSVRAGVDAARVTLVHPAHDRPWPVHMAAGEPPPTASSVRESRNAYLDRVLAEHGTITLPAFGKGRTLTRVSLDRLYVGLRGEITTRSQRLAAERYAQALRAAEGFDEAGWLATHRDLREARNAAEVLSTAAPLNLAQALEAVASLDFRLVILGDPGSGKSTISQWLALTMAAALREDRDALSLARAGLFPEEADREGPPVVIPGTCLPVLIRVSRYAEFLLGQDGREPPMDLLTYATEQVVNAVVPAHRATLRYYVDEMAWRGRLLVILDGLDELPDTPRAHAPGAPWWQQRIRETVLEQIRLLAAAFRPGTDAAGMPLRRNALLVTSRIKGYDFNSLLPGELTHLTIEPMSGAERREFFHHWTRAVVDGGQTAHDALRDGAHRFCTDLSREVEADRRLRREVTTPQIAGLIASVALDSWQALSGGAAGGPAPLGRLLPRSRTEIYGSVVELLLGRWTDDRYWGPGTRDEALARLMSEPGQLLRVLKEVALAIHADRDLQSGDVDEPRLARIVVEAAARLQIPWREACTSVDTFTGFMVPLLTQHSGFMGSRAPGVFAFQHRSIQEYLAGRLLAEGNAADGTREGEWAELRRFVRDPQQLIQWREVTWHALAHLQLIDPAAFLRLAAESLLEEAAAARPFPVTLLLLLEVAPTLPRAGDPRFVGMLVSTMLRVFVEQAPLREPLWPAFGAALLALPPEPVSTVLTEALREVAPGMAAGVAEIVLRLGAVRPLTAWMNATLVSRLIRARHLDSDELGWPVHRCLARVLTAWEGAAALEQVPELRADEARAWLSRPECQAALLSDADFARSMLALTGCIDSRESVYLGEYLAFARFLSLDEGVRDAWLPFLQDYWGEDDSIYGIAVHMDMDFANASAGAAVLPSLRWQYGLSVNPRVPRLVAAGAARQAGVRARLEAAGTWVMRMSNEERYLMLIAESGAEAAGLAMQAGNERLVRLLRQRVALLDDGIYRGVRPLLALVRRAGEGSGKTNGEAALLHAALKAVVRTLGSGGMQKGDEEAFRPPYLYYAQDGAALAEWWVFACNGLVTSDYRGDDWVARNEPLLEWFGAFRREGLNWLYALLEVSTAGALAHRRSHARVPVEVLYPHLPERYDGDLPYHALTVFTLLPWETRPLTRRLADVLLEQLEAAFPAAAAECQAVRWILEGPVPGSDAGWADPSLEGLETRVPETAAGIESPYHRARFLVRMLPYVPAEAREGVRAAVSAALGEVEDPTARLLVAEPLHRATLELFLRGQAGEDEVAEAERAWGDALAAVTDPVHRTLGAARAAFALEGKRRSALIRHAVECAAGIQDTVALAGVLREVRPVAELDPVARKGFARLVRTVKSSAWRQWALGRDSGVLAWLGERVEPGGTEFVAFAALHTRVLLQEALLAMDADHGPNAEALWMRCLRREVPVGALVAHGRLESYDLTPVLALALDELLERDDRQEAAELLPLCVNPGPQVLPAASRWAAHPDPRVARHGRLLCAEILGYVPERWLGAWAELLEDPDDRTRFRAGQCVRHPLPVPRWRRQRFSRLGLPYLLAWDDAVQLQKARGGPAANEMGWLTQDFVADSRAGLQALIDQARDGSAAGGRARRLLRGFEIVDESSRQCLVQTLRVETDPVMQHCLLAIVFRAVHRGTLVRARLDAVRETLRAPVLAAVCDRRFFVPATADYLVVFGELWEAGRGARVSRAAFIEAMEARCGLRLADLEGKPVEEFVEACSRIALSHYFCPPNIIGYLAQQVETRWAVAGLEFFLQWFCDAAPMESRPADLQGDHRDHLLLVAAALSASIPSLIRGNVRLPAALEPRLREVVMKGPGWPERMAALELLGSIASAGPEFLDCLVRGVVDTAAVRTTAFRVAARMRDVDDDFIERVIPRLHDESGIVAYAMGRVLKNAFLHSETTPDARERIIQALTLAKDSASARRTVYFEHHSRINLPHLPRLDQHFARLVGEIWLGDQAPTLQRSRSGWERPPPALPAETPPSAEPVAATSDA